MIVELVGGWRLTRSECIARIYLKRLVSNLNKNCMYEKTYSDEIVGLVGSDLDDIVRCVCVCASQQHVAEGNSASQLWVQRAPMKQICIFVLEKTQTIQNQRSLGNQILNICMAQEQRPIDIVLNILESTQMKILHSVNLQNHCYDVIWIQSLTNVATTHASWHYTSVMFPKPYLLIISYGFWTSFNCSSGPAKDYTMMHNLQRIRYADSIFESGKDCSVLWTLKSL